MLRARTCAAIFVVFLKYKKRDLGASNMLINVEVEANKSEVHLNSPLDTSREKGWIKSRNQVSRSRRSQEKSQVKKKIKQVDRVKKIVKDVNSKSR